MNKEITDFERNGLVQFYKNVRQFLDNLCDILLKDFDEDQITNEALKLGAKVRSLRMNIRKELYEQINEFVEISIEERLLDSKLTKQFTTINEWDYLRVQIYKEFEDFADNVLYPQIFD